jgi:hypothetical protein
MSFSAIKPGGWTTGDSLTAGQANQIQTDIQNAFDISGSNTSVGANTFTGGNIFTNNVFLNGQTIVANTSKFVINSVSSLAALRAISSPLDGQLAVLEPYPAVDFPLNSIVYRYDSVDTLTKDFYVANVATTGRLPYYAVKPGGTISGGQNGVAGIWKPLNNAAFPKGQYNMYTQNSPVSIGSSGSPIPINSAWTQTGTSCTYNMNGLGFSNATIFCTDPGVCTSDGYGMIAKAENYYDISITYSAAFQFANSPGGGSMILGGLIAQNNSITYPVGNASPITNPGYVNWQMLTGFTSSTFGNYATPATITQRFQIRSSATNYDAINFFLAVSGTTALNYINVTSGYPQTFSFQITAH